MNNYKSNELLKLFVNSDYEQIISLAPNLEKKEGVICVLVPYQNMLGKNIDVDVDAINKAIAESAINIEEGFWHLILWSGSSLEFFSFKTSVDFDVKQASFNDDYLNLFSRVGFQYSSCMQIENSAFIKYKLKNRTYITFGKK